MRPIISIVLSALTAACATTPVLAPDDTAQRLSGVWELDAHASDNVRDRLLPLFKAREEKWRRSEGRYAPSPDEERGAPTMDWLVAERRRDADELIARLSPSQELQISASPREVRFKGTKGEGTRVLKPGESSALIMAQGRFELSSMWDQNTLVIDLRGDDNPLRVTERVASLDGGLQILMVAKVPEIGKQSFRFVYRRRPS